MHAHSVKLVAYEYVRLGFEMVIARALDKSYYSMT